MTFYNLKKYEGNIHNFVRDIFTSITSIFIGIKIQGAWGIHSQLFTSFFDHLTVFY